MTPAEYRRARHAARTVRQAFEPIEPRAGCATTRIPDAIKADVARLAEALGSSTAAAYVYNVSPNNIPLWRDEHATI